MSSLKTVCISVLLLSFSYVYAQAPPPPGSENQGAPLGFVELLLGAGAAFGAKKAYDKKKKQSPD